MLSDSGKDRSKVSLSSEGYDPSESKETSACWQSWDGNSRIGLLNVVLGNFIF